MRAVCDVGLCNSCQRIRALYESKPNGIYWLCKECHQEHKKNPVSVSERVHKVRESKFQS